MPPRNIQGARETPLAGLAQRVTQAVRFVITGVRPDTWFGPFQPLAPMAPEQEGVKGRRFDYSTGINLNYIPRSSEAIGFGELRALADSCDVLRAVIEARKDQMAALDWVIRPRQAPDGSEPSLWYKQGAKAHPEIPAEQQKRIDAITQFFQYPDREQPWDQWQREWLESVFVIDAPAIWRRRDRGGHLYALELIDGATIKPLLAADGRRPTTPDPAYQQILHGVPAADFTSEELLYVPWNIRTNHIYGYSKVEQILVTVNTFIRRALFQLNYYTEGSQPDAFMGLPKEWNLQQIKDFQDYMDSLLIGNLQTRRHLRFVPGEFKYQETKGPPLKDAFDEYLARVVCFTFAVAPDPFIEHVSRGAVEKSHTRALEEGLEPTQRYVKINVDRIIIEDFASPDLEFKYVEDREQDPKAQMEVDTGYVKAGIFAIDDVRIARGKNPLGGPASIPMLATASGYVPLGTLTQPGSAGALAAAGGPAAQAQQHLQGGGNRPAGNTGAEKDYDPHDTDHLDEFGHLKKLLEEDSPELTQLKKYYVNSEASQGMQGRWWPGSMTPRDLNLNSPQEPQRTYPPARGPEPISHSRPTTYPRSSSPDYQAEREPQTTSNGRHPEPQYQPRLDYYVKVQDTLSVLRKAGMDHAGSGAIPPDQAVPVNLEVASKLERAQVAHVAWNIVQSSSFKIVPKTISIDKIVAMQDDVDKERVLSHEQYFEAHGDYKKPPLLLSLNGKYFILDGHHRVEGAKAAGADSLICDLLENTGEAVTLDPGLGDDNSGNIIEHNQDLQDIVSSLSALESELAPLIQRTQ